MKKFIALGLLMFSSSAMATQLDDYKANPVFASNMLLIQNSKTLLEIEPTRRRWCDLADLYDQVVADYTAVIRDREFLSRVTFKSEKISAAEMPLFQGALSAVELEYRAAARRCS